MTASPSMLEAALSFASARGWPVFPCKDKQPLTKHGCKDATTDRGQIRRWWKKWPDAQIGVRTGRAKGACSNLYVVDEDEGGAETIAALALPSTLTAVTGSGGRHYYFRRPDVEKIGNTAKKKLGPGVDGRGDGGYVIVPPSSGAWQAYAWIDETTPVAMLPDNVLEKLQSKKTPAPRGAPIPSGRPAKGYGDAALVAECAKVSNASEGTRNDTLNSAAFSLGQLVGGGVLDEGVVRADLTDAARAAGLDDDEIEKTINSGLEGGKREPRTPPPRSVAKATRTPRSEPTDPADPRGDDDAPPPDDDAPAWLDDLTTRADGAVKATIANVLVILENAADLAGVFGYDEFATRTTFLRAAPWGEGKHGQPVGDADVVRLTAHLSRRYGCDAEVTTVGRALEAAALRRAYNPVRDYLDGLQHDGAARIDTWLVDHLGAEDSAYTRAVGRRILIAAVARAYDPGCQVDSALVLEGSQGTGKSTAVKTLSRGFYTDDVPDLTDAKESAGALKGAWLVELSELEGMRRADATRIKAFISRRVDRFRPPYGHHLQEYPRRCVFIATTNESTYLADATGGRRFWPVRCGAINTAALAVVVDQLWAEGVAAYRAGASHWLDTDELHAEASAHQEDRLERDTWEEEAAEFLRAHDSVTTKELLDHLRVDANMQKRTDAMRAANVVRAAGFTHRRQVRLPDGRRSWRYWRATTFEGGGDRGSAANAGVPSGSASTVTTVTTSSSEGDRDEGEEGSAHAREAPAQTRVRDSSVPGGSVVTGRSATPPQPAPAHYTGAGDIADAAGDTPPSEPDDFDPDPATEWWSR